MPTKLCCLYLFRPTANNQSIPIYLSIGIDNRYDKPIDNHTNLRHRLVIDYQYQSINWYRFVSIDIDCHRLSILSIGYPGNNSQVKYSRISILEYIINTIYEVPTVTGVTDQRDCRFMGKHYVVSWRRLLMRSNLFLVLFTCFISQVDNLNIEIIILWLSWEYAD